MKFIAILLVTLALAIPALADFGNNGGNYGSSTGGGSSSSGGVTTNSINIQNFDPINFATGFDFSNNQVIVTGFGRAADNGIYTYNPNLNYTDYNASPAVGGYTNTTGSFLLPTPGNASWYLFTNADLSNGADYGGLLNTNINYVQTPISWAMDTFGTGSVGTVSWYDLHPRPHIQTGGNYTGSVIATNGTTIRHPLNNPYPMFNFNLWNNDCAGANSIMSETALTNAVNLCKAIGLEPYIDGWMLDGLWNAGQGITNGIPYYTEDTNVWKKLGGVAGASQWIHTNTTSKIFWSWIGISDLSTNHVLNLLDVTNYVVKYNFDGVSLDTTTFTDENGIEIQVQGENELEAFRRVGWGANKNFQVRWNGNGFLAHDNPIFVGETHPGGWQVQRMIVDADGGEIGPSESNSGYTTFIQTVDNAVNKIASFPDGSYPQMPELWALPIDTAFATNAWQSFALMTRCVMPMNVFINRTNGLKGIMPWVTNADVVMLAHDSQLSKGRQISSNGMCRVWGRSLSGNRSVVVFLNASTNSAYSTTTTVNLRDLGYSPAQQVQARRIYFSTNYTVTGTISVSSIDTNCAVGFLLTPVNLGSFMVNSGSTNVTTLTSFTATFATPFLDTNYTATATGNGFAVAGGYVSNKTTTSCVFNMTVATGLIDWIATHP